MKTLRIAISLEDEAGDTLRRHDLVYNEHSFGPAIVIVPELREALAVMRGKEGPVSGAVLDDALLDLDPVPRRRH